MGERRDLETALTASLAEYLAKRGEAEHLSCLSAAVNVTGAPPVTAQTGATERGGTIPVTGRHLFQIGSNTKSFTATAVLQLEAQQTIDIDAPVVRYLPDYPHLGGLTLRQCLQMTGHLESYDNLRAWAEPYAANPHADVSADHLIRLGSESPLRPEAWYYSNTGYLIAQQVVERYAPGGYAGAIGQITASCGLTNTFYAPHSYPPAIAEWIVAGYYLNNDPGLEQLLTRDISRYSVSWAQGAGAMVATPEDLAVWARVLYCNNPLLPREQLEKLHSLVSMQSGTPMAEPNATDPSGFGLGVGKRYGASFDNGDQLHWFYEGETLGFRALHLYSAYFDFVLCVFANSRPISTNDAFKELSMALYADVVAHLGKN